MILQNYTNEMYKVLKLNNIAEEGLSVFDLDRFHCGDDVTNPDAIILRSFDMHDMDIQKILKQLEELVQELTIFPLINILNKLFLFSTRPVQILMRLKS